MIRVVNTFPGSTRAAAVYVLIFLLVLFGTAPAFTLALPSPDNQHHQYADYHECVGGIPWQPTKPIVNPLAVHVVPASYKPDDSLANLRSIHPPIFAPDVKPLASHLVYTQTTSSHL